MTSTDAILIMKNVDDDNRETNFNLKRHANLIDKDLDHQSLELTKDHQSPLKDETIENENASFVNLIPVVALNDENMSPFSSDKMKIQQNTNDDSPFDDEITTEPMIDTETVTRVASCTSDESTFDQYYRHSSASLDGDDEFDDVINDPIAVSSKLKEMEEEQEQLNNSLIALTSHFAQVQLRLKQIVSASSDEKERLLKDLEEFAFSGIPDLASVNQMVSETQDEINEDKNHDCSVESATSSRQSSPRRRRKSEIKLSTDTDISYKLQNQREKQKKLMNKLKDQLEELEKYAYETGDTKCIPSSILIERQNVIIEQLKCTLALNLDGMDKLSPDELRQQVDQAVKNLIDPVIMKEQLVEQLKTQVTDLERFIEYLQAGQVSMKCKKNGKHFKLIGTCTCACPLHGNSVTSVQKYNPLIANERKKQQHQCNGDKNCHNNTCCCGTDDTDNHYQHTTSAEAIRIIKRVMTLLQMVTVTQFGCNKSVKKYQRNIFNNKYPHTTTGDCEKSTDNYDLWNHLKNKLDSAVDHLIEITQEKFANDSDYTSDSDDNVFTSPNDDSIDITGNDDISSCNGHVDTCQHETTTTTTTTATTITSDMSGNGIRSQKLTHAVRKELCSALTDLLEHGLREDVTVSNSLMDSHSNESNQSSALVASFFIWGCFSDKSSSSSSSIDRLSSTSSSRDGKWQRPCAWNIFMKFYHLKDGTCYTSAPARRLSQSFNLPIVSGSVVTPKQSLLMAIFDICQSHTPLKRSPESHFKALVSRALNEGKLTSWLRQVVKSRGVTQSMYEPWSYVVTTGFDDILQSLDRLNSIRFNLPTDLAIRQLKSISDAF